MKPALLFCFASVVLAAPDGAARNPVELGIVSWRRDFDTAAAEASRRNRDLFVLFQEVPGWGTCRTFGAQVLGDRLLADAIEELFVPVCVYNNKKGKDAATLARFGEASWNNPVVRIMDTTGKDLVPANRRGWNVAAVVRQISAVQKKRGRALPGYIGLLVQAAAGSSRVHTAVFGMSWYWVGEVEFGLLDGVLFTYAGWLGGKEVVEVTFDPRVTSYERLVRHAQARNCTSPVFARDKEQLRIARKIVGDKARTHTGAVRGVKDNKYRLGRTPLRHVPLTRLQATRINADTRQATRWLSPGQRALLALVRKHPRAGWPVLIGVDARTAWPRAEAIARKLREAR